MRDCITEQRVGAHCWHTVSSWTNGLATSGEETARCCHCGAHADRKWRSVEDPAHGPYSTNRVMDYGNYVWRQRAK